MNFDDHPLVVFRVEGQPNKLAYGYLFTHEGHLLLARTKEDAAAGRPSVALYLDRSLLEELPNSAPSAREFRYLRPLAEH